MKILVSEIHTFFIKTEKMEGKKENSQIPLSLATV